jgi:hypothetical protein
MAMHGAEVVGIELREANLAKAQFAKNYLGLDNLTLHKDDVRNLSVEKYGKFDVVICSGILYHLTTPDVFRFVRQIYEVCTRLAIFDTQIALHPREMVEFEGQPFHGIWFTEHDPSADKETRLKDVWASVDNSRSFSFTQPSLSNLISSVGFSSFFECLNPAHAVPPDRCAYVAIRGRAGSIRTSAATESMGMDPTPERNLLRPAEAQIKRGQFFRLAKRLLRCRSPSKTL